MKQLLKRNSVVQKTSRKLKNAGKSKNSTGARNNNDGSGVVFSVVAVVVIFGSLLGIVVVQTFIVQNRVRLDAVNADLDDAREINQQLRLEVIELEAPERILDTAVTRLGMTRPAERTYLPGKDPDLEEIRPPGPGDPFGPGILPEHLRDPEIEQDSSQDNGATSEGP